MADEEILDRDVVARILRRATELEQRTLPSNSGFGEAALLAAADEVGLCVEAVRRSIAVERLGPAPPRRVGDRILGAGVLVVDDEIAGQPAEVLARLDAWMVAGHHLRRDRLRDDSGEWSKRSGMVGVVIRALRGATGEGRLGEFRRVSATARDAGRGSSVVRVSVDRSHSRRAAAGGGTIVAVGGTLGVVIGAAAAGPVLLLAAPVAILAGVGVALAGRGRAKKAELEMGRLLEAVHQGNRPTRLGVDVVKRVTRGARAR